MTRTFLLALLLPINIAPQAGQAQMPAPSHEGHAAGPAVATPFTIADPMCQTGFTVSQRFDERNAAGAIIKSVWVRKCVRVPRIVYGRKV